MKEALFKPINNMSNEIAKKPQTLKEYVFNDDTKKKFESLLKDRTSTFLTSLVQIANSNDMLKTAEPLSIINAALTAATLDLPLNNNLGFAWIVPFRDNKTGTTLAQFQLGWKGFIQLAQRSGQFKSIGQSPIYEGQIVSNDPLNGYEFDFTKKDSEKVIGYAARFTLINGFSATLYMSKEDVTKHATKYSQTFKKGFGVWKDNFDAMAKKTVIKLLLSQYAPLSVTMQTALLADQTVIKESEDGNFEYIDNTVEIDPLPTIDDLRELLDMKRDAISVEELKDANRIINNNETTSFKKLQTLLMSK